MSDALLKITISQSPNRLGSNLSAKVSRGRCYVSYWIPLIISIIEQSNIEGALSYRYQEYHDFPNKDIFCELELLIGRTLFFPYWHLSSPAKPTKAMLEGVITHSTVSCGS